jgi:hypothetical protein
LKLREIEVDNGLKASANSLSRRLAGSACRILLLEVREAGDFVPALDPAAPGVENLIRVMECFDYSSSVRSDFASCKSLVSKPSVNQP